MKRIAAAALACATCVTAAYGQGTEAFPQRPLRLITGFLPGGVSDTIARVVEDMAQIKLTQRSACPRTASKHGEAARPPGSATP